MFATLQSNSYTVDNNLWHILLTLKLKKQEMYAQHNSGVTAPFCLSSQNKV
jgi:hypothetical protein